MKFRYEYRTRDNVRHEGFVRAVSREAAFETLKSRGVKPSFVALAPGLFNKLLSWGWRWLVVLVVVMFLLLGAVLLSRQPVAGGNAASSDSISAPRHQIYGDPEVIQRIERGGLALILTNAGDRILASYAQPARVINACLPSDCSFPDEIGNVVNDDLDIDAGDLQEVRELKQIVNGMKAELRIYLAAGTGTTASYLRRLSERQMQEKRIEEGVQAELKNEKDVRVWEEKNAQLRRIGLRPISLPASFYQGEVEVD
ncbi:MAG: hypothetical protein IJS97_04210 [Prevotella sp.]|nr:hypothetical protein [Prevotella sp.]